MPETRIAVNDEAPSQKEVIAATKLLALLSIAKRNSYLPEDGFFPEVIGDKLLEDEEEIRKRAGDILVRKSLYGVKPE